MQRSWAKIGIVTLIAILAIAGALWATRWFAPGALDRRPKIVETPPLPPVSRSSMIVAPAVITLTAIRTALEKAAPPEANGKLPKPPMLPKAEIGWSVTRAPFDITGRPDGLSLSTALRGSMNATGIELPRELPKPPGGFSGPPPGFGPPGGFRGPPGFGPFGGFFGPPGGGGRGQDQSGSTGSSDKPQEQSAAFSGNVTLSARPNILAGWRLSPNLTAQISIADASLSIMGMQLNLSNEMRPMLERMASEQVNTLQNRVSNDPFIEQAARRGWADLCRSIALAPGVPGAPKLWLELRPTRAMAAQPRIDNAAVTLTVGIRADTRIVPNETKPDCPFPSQLDLVQQLDQGRATIDMPIDMPLAEVKRQIESQIKGKVFPEDKRGAVTATINSVDLIASGDRLLMSLGITANEHKSWFGFGADAVVHVWGVPVLDPRTQTLRFEDVKVDIESEAAFGALALAARAAMPALERTLADNAKIDLRPMIAEMRRSVEAVISDSRNSPPGVQVDASVVDLRLADIAFDAKTVRVVIQAEGTVRIVVTELPERQQ